MGKYDKIDKKFRNYSLTGFDFTFCVTDGMWFVSRWDVIHTNTNKQAVYIFGTDGVYMTFYNRNNPNFQLVDLAYDTLVKHLEESPDDFKTVLFRFEFDGQKFNYCEKEPKWASYDCGVLRE
ncbi:MAG: hypothetical protein HYS78_01755 [Parcubacteria group bacterium]|nr:hypothetical protein [Parcubacteria group bacterium]